MAVFKTVTVLGTGVLGSQIAFQVARHGIPVQSYDISQDALDQGSRRLGALVEQYVTELGADKLTPARDAVARIHLTTDLGQAVADADLVIEAVPENIELKRQVYGRLAQLAPERTVFATNASTLLPSRFAEATGRPDRFLALHFATHIWRHNIAEVMGTSHTDPAVYRAVVEFAREIGTVPIELHKEQPGHVLNSLLIPMLHAAAKLLINGVADVATIDTTWKIATSAPSGPFEVFDKIGLRTAYAVASAFPDAEGLAFADHLKTAYLDQGKLGLESGEGFHTYGPAAA
ncbi:3-hydroxyacyl-CoA dehydrogenase [Streptomyces sp. NPDC001070]